MRAALDETVRQDDLEASVYAELEAGEAHFGLLDDLDDDLERDLRDDEFDDLDESVPNADRL